MKLPPKTIERLLLYRVLLIEQEALDKTTIHSHELAELANNTSAQVRRDIMATGYSGKPTSGYEISQLLKKIDLKLNLNSKVKVALVGIGNLGNAILSFFRVHKTRFELVAAFDTDKQKINKTKLGCKIYSIKKLPSIVKKENILLGIIATPDKNAQDVATLLSDSGVKGILNFTSTPLKVPKHVKLNRIDITLQLEMLAFCSQ